MSYILKAECSPALFMTIKSRLMKLRHEKVLSVSMDSITIELELTSQPPVETSKKSKSCFQRIISLVPLNRRGRVRVAEELKALVESTLVRDMDLEELKAVKTVEESTACVNKVIEELKVLEETKARVEKTVEVLRAEEKSYESNVAFNRIKASLAKAAEDLKALEKNVLEESKKLETVMSCKKKEFKDVKLLEEIKSNLKNNVQALKAEEKALELKEAQDRALEEKAAKLEIIAEEMKASKETLQSLQELNSAKESQEAAELRAKETDAFLENALKELKDLEDLRACEKKAAELKAEESDSFLKYVIEKLNVLEARKNEDSKRDEDLMALLKMDIDEKTELEDLKVRIDKTLMTFEKRELKAFVKKMKREKKNSRELKKQERRQTV